MLDHHIQQRIVAELAKHNSPIGFSALKPAELDNKLFDYHLKITIRGGYVVKTEHGYQLSPVGKKLWKRTRETPELIANRAFSVIFIRVCDSESRELVYRRHTQPLKDFVGYIHVTPLYDQPITETATKLVFDITGVEAQPLVRGSGFFRIFKEGALESFTNFTLLELAIEQAGPLKQIDPTVEYFWTDSIRSTTTHLLPNMPHLIKALNQNTLFFIDKKIEIS